MWLTGPVAPRHVGSSQTRVRTRVPCIGRQILNHCATREAPESLLTSGMVWGFGESFEWCHPYLSMERWASPLKPETNLGTDSPMVLPENFLAAIGTYFSHTVSLQLFKEPQCSLSAVEHRALNQGRRS